VKATPHPAVKSAPKLQRIAAIHLGFEKSGVQIEEVVDPRATYPASAILAVTSERTTHIVWDYSGLRGLVQITSPEAALKYVRLTALPGAVGYIPFRAAVEIVDIKRFVQMRDMEGKPKELPQDWRRDFHSGLEEILSETAYRASPFKPPHVVRGPSGFIVNRWVYLFWGPERVMQIREMVGPDGSYQRVVCKQMPPPKLPNTKWGMVVRL